MIQTNNEKWCHDCSLHKQQTKNGTLLHSENSQFQGDCVQDAAQKCCNY